MPHGLLTADLLMREILRVLHQKLNFLGNVYRHYDNSFSAEGWKAGSALRIPLPNQFTTGTGADITGSLQTVVETNTTIDRATQRFVALEGFTSKQLSLDLNRFSERFIEPAMAQLASDIENDALSMIKDVPQLVDHDGTAFSFLTLAEGRRKLNEKLAPMDNQRSCLLSPAHNVKFIDAAKGLFHASTNIEEQYRMGEIGKTLGATFYENTLITDHATGTALKGATGYLSNGATQSGASISVDTGTTTFKKGDIITFAGVEDVHPESKASLGFLKQFVLTADAGPSATTLAISPALVATGARKNASGTIADNSAVSKIGAGASELLNSSIMFHKEAFAFATADLPLPEGVHLRARRVQDGISARMIQDYNVLTDVFVTRIDVLYGFKTIRPQLAVRLHADG